MRYLIQILAMIIEVAIVIAAAFIIYENPRDPLTWVLVILGYMAWESQGGFMAWNLKNIRKFLANAKDIGL